MSTTLATLAWSPHTASATSKTASPARVATPSATAFTTPGPFTYEVPVGACGVAADAVGGAGATPPETDFFGVGSHFEGAGGHGDEVRATIAAVGGETLQGIVAGRGIDGAGGAGGGGSTTVGPANPSAFGGGGGGATDVRRGSSLDDRLLVAGGGGGGGALGVIRVYLPEYGQGMLMPIHGVAGGHAGKPGEGGHVEIFDENGLSSDGNSVTTGGGGATATAPGAGGIGSGGPGSSGSPGELGLGASTTAIGPGAGGGGRYGGGSGALAGGGAEFGSIVRTAGLTSGWSASGGGGGSDWVEPTAINVTTVSGAGTADGRLTLTPIYDPSQCPQPKAGSTTTTSAPIGTLVATVVTKAATPATPVQSAPRFTG